jgi:hypothetical protein
MQRTHHLDVSGRVERRSPEDRYSGPASCFPAYEHDELDYLLVPRCGKLVSVPDCIAHSDAIHARRNDGGGAWQHRRLAAKRAVGVSCHRIIRIHKHPCLATPARGSPRGSRALCHACAARRRAGCWRAHANSVSSSERVSRRAFGSQGGTSLWTRSSPTLGGFQSIKDHGVRADVAPED